LAPNAKQSDLAKLNAQTTTMSLEPLVIQETNEIFDAVEPPPTFKIMRTDNLLVSLHELSELSDDTPLRIVSRHTSKFAENGGTEVLRYKTVRSSALLKLFHWALKELFKLCLEGRTISKR
jgi:hypothetical protein